MLQVSLREKENSNAKIAVIDRVMLLHNISWIVSCCYSDLFHNSVQHIHKRCIWYGKWENVCPDKNIWIFAQHLKKSFFHKDLTTNSTEEFYHHKAKRWEQQCPFSRDSNKSWLFQKMHSSLLILMLLQSFFIIGSNLLK